MNGHIIALIILSPWLGMVVLAFIYDKAVRDLRDDVNDLLDGRDKEDDAEWHTGYSKGYTKGYEQAMKSRRVVSLPVTPTKEN